MGGQIAVTCTGTIIDNYSRLLCSFVAWFHGNSPFLEPVLNSYAVFLKVVHGLTVINDSGLLTKLNFSWQGYFTSNAIDLTIKTLTTLEEYYIQMRMPVLKLV
jgi:hypothetical protein